MLRVLLFLLAFGLTVIGFTYIVVYLNLFSQGYNLSEYLAFISKRSECILGIIGFILITIIIFTRRDNYDLYI